MGGISTSELRFVPDGHALFCGQVSLEHNGGFASVRCRAGDFGRPGVRAYLLQVLGDGKQYKLNLRTDADFDGINYQARFSPPPGTWATCRLATHDFMPTWRGKPVTDGQPLDPARVHQVGLMIADRQAGPFALAIRWIAAELD